MRLSEISARLQATVVRDAEFFNLGFLFDDLPDKLLFVEAGRFVSAARKARGARCVLCSGELTASFPDAAGLATTAEPKLAFFHLQRFLVEETDFYGAPFPTEIHPSARIHPRAWPILTLRSATPQPHRRGKCDGGRALVDWRGCVHTGGRSPRLRGLPVGTVPRRHFANGPWWRPARGGRSRDIRQCRDRQSGVPPDDLGGRIFQDRKRGISVAQRTTGEALFRGPQQYRQWEHDGGRRYLDRPKRNHQQPAHDRTAKPHLIRRGGDAIAAGGSSRHRDAGGRSPAHAAPRRFDSLNGMPPLMRN